MNFFPSSAAPDVGVAFSGSPRGFGTPFFRKRVAPLSGRWVPSSRPVKRALGMFPASTRAVRPLDPSIHSGTASCSRTASGSGQARDTKDRGPLETATHPSLKLRRAGGERLDYEACQSEPERHLEVSPEVGRERQYRTPRFMISPFLFFPSRAYGNVLSFSRTEVRKIGSW